MKTIVIAPFTVHIEPTATGWRADLGFWNSTSSILVGHYSSEEEATTIGLSDARSLLIRTSQVEAISYEDWVRQGKRPA